MFGITALLISTTYVTSSSCHWNTILRQVIWRVKHWFKSSAYLYTACKRNELASAINDLLNFVIWKYFRCKRNKSKLKSNLQEVKSRWSQMIVFEDENSKVQAMEAMEVIQITSNLGRISAPIIFTIPLQLLSYHLALIKGTNVAKPRNLAK